MTPVCSVGIMFDLTNVGCNLKTPRRRDPHYCGVEENPSEAVHQRG